MNSYPKDIALEGIYVMRCKCGARPYHDRIATYPTPQWIKCNSCGRTGESDCDKQTAIDNWNNNIIIDEYKFR
jgi:hypothetical protein